MLISAPGEAFSVTTSASRLFLCRFLSSPQWLLHVFFSFCCFMHFACLLKELVKFELGWGDFIGSWRSEESAIHVYLSLACSREICSLIHFLISQDSVWAFVSFLHSAETCRGIDWPVKSQMRSATVFLFWPCSVLLPLFVFSVFSFVLELLVLWVFFLMGFVCVMQGFIW